MSRTRDGRTLPADNTLQCAVPFSGILSGCKRATVGLIERDLSESSPPGRDQGSVDHPEVGTERERRCDSAGLKRLF